MRCLCAWRYKGKGFRKCSDLRGGPWLRVCLTGNMIGTVSGGEKKCYCHSVGQEGFQK